MREPSYFFNPSSNNEADPLLPVSSNKDASKVQFNRERIKSYLFSGANFFYTIFVSILFAAFSKRRAHNNPILGWWYAICSFALNAPLAWNFSIKTVETYQRVKQGERAFRVAAVVGLSLALLTTAAGFQVATESVGSVGCVSNFCTVSMTALSVFNTFSTRLVGSVYLLYDIYSSFRRFVRNFNPGYAALYQFERDLSAHGDKVLVEVDYSASTDEMGLLVKYISTFYSEMAKESLKPVDKTHYMLTKSKIFMPKLFMTAIFIINMMPLWLELTVEGSKQLPGNLDQSKAFVFLAAFSNEAFYLNSGMSFINDLLITVQRGLYRIKEKSVNRNAGSSAVMLSSFAGAICLLAVMAYYSGGGYGEDAYNATTIVNATTNQTKTDVNAFGPMTNELWFSWLAGEWTMVFINLKLYDKTAQVASAAVNAGAFLGFCLAVVPFLKQKNTDDTIFNAESANKLLSKGLQGYSIDSLNNKGVLDAVHFGVSQARKALYPEKGEVAPGLIN
jgi:hypothetical protein